LSTRFRNYKNPLPNTYSELPSPTNISEKPSAITLLIYRITHFASLRSIFAIPHERRPAMARIATESISGTTLRQILTARDEVKIEDGP
jgi:hypothetical protein